VTLAAVSPSRFLLLGEEPVSWSRKNEWRFWKGNCRRSNPLTTAYSIRGVDKVLSLGVL
jgi:hypothetical protein